METKLVKVPFDIEMAKKITNKEIKGRVITEDGRPVKIVYFSNVATNAYRVLYVVNAGEDGECSYWAENNGSSEEETADLMIEIPEYLTFKDGDVIAFGSKCVGIFKNIDFKRKTFFSYATFFGNQLTFYETGWVLKNSHIATETEKQRLIEALKESTDERAKDCLKMLGIENSPKLSNSSKVGNDFELKPFDKVLVRDGKNQKWKPAFFWCRKDFFKTIGFGDWVYCIPYEGNEHLLDTANNPEDHK